MKRFIKHFILFFATLFLLQSDVFADNVLKLSLTTFPKTFNPVTSQDANSTQLLEHVFEGLTKTDPHSGKVIPHLAEGWEVDRSGKVWQIKLRPHVTWSDGAPLTAEDVVFTYEKIIFNPNVITSARSIFTIKGELLTLKALDRYTVEFRLPEPFAPFLRSLSQPILPKHILETVIEDNVFNETWGISTEPEELIGTGPFVLKKYQTGESVYFVRNDAYWKKDSEGTALPYLDGILYQVISNQDLGLLKFKNGELDVFPFRGKAYPWLKQYEAEKGFKIHELGPHFGTYFLAFNQNQRKHPQSGRPFVHPKKSKWFQQVPFRQAVSHAVNREQISQLVFQGFAVPQYAAVSPAVTEFHASDVKQYPFDLDLARELLKEIGYLDIDDDGWIEDDTGEEIKFNLVIASAADEQVKIANLIRHDFATLGIRVNLQTLEFNTLVSKLTYSFDWDAVLIGLTGGIEPYFGANVWKSSGPLHLWNPKQETPATEWEKEIDQIFEDSAVTLDPEERRKMFVRWQQIVAEKVPLIYTVIPERLVAVQQRVKNIQPSALGGVLHTPEEIRLAG